MFGFFHSALPPCTRPLNFPPQTVILVLNTKTGAFDKSGIATPPSWPPVRLKIVRRLQQKKSPPTGSTCREEFTRMRFQKTKAATTSKRSENLRKERMLIAIPQNQCQCRPSLGTVNKWPITAGNTCPAAPVPPHRSPTAPGLPHHARRA